MAKFPPSLREIHRFLEDHLFYPLALSSLLAEGTYAARLYYTHDRFYSFLVWNLFLAWIPYACSLLMAFLHRFLPVRPWLYAAIGIVWLLFFPNAPYILTDFVHLQKMTPFAWWYDLMLVQSFSWSGVFLGVISLYIVQAFVRERIGAVACRIFVGIIIGLTGLGIYLGRYVRLNSWDFFLHPRGVIRNALAPFMDPVNHQQALYVMVLYSSFLLVCYLIFAGAKASRSIL
jgi:uncharacterized membrane protein